MNILRTQLNNYLEFCQFQKRLDFKTLKAYRIDLTQFIHQVAVNDISSITTDILENHIATYKDTLYCINRH